VCRSTAKQESEWQFIMRASFRPTGVVAVPGSRVSTVNSKHHPAWTDLELCGPRKHLLKPDADAFDDGEQDGAADGTVPRRLVSTANGERATCEETRNLDRVRRLSFGRG